jgi:hypothetical protein
MERTPPLQRSLRYLAEQAFSRAAGAPLIPGNSIRLLRDSTENYPAWLEAIRSATLDSLQAISLPTTPQGEIHQGPCSQGPWRGPRSGGL